MHLSDQFIQDLFNQINKPEGKKGSNKLYYSRLAHVLHVERFCIRYIILLSFSASNNLTVTVWRNKRIVYVLSTLSQLADNVQVTRITSKKDGRE